MTQGAPTDEATTELSLSDWLAKRGLAGKKRMEVGGQWFNFLPAATAAQITAFSEARDKGDLLGAMTALLANPKDADKLKAAFVNQPQPIEAGLEREFLVAIVNFLVAGDAGESSAS